MEIGKIVEYIDQQKITCAIVLEIKKQRLRLLTEFNREVNLSSGRVIHTANTHVDLSQGRDNIVNKLKDTSTKRNDLSHKIDIKELWELLNEEQEWIDITTMAEYCFSEDITPDHESSVIRAFFNNRIYFKFNNNSFFPNTPDHVDRAIVQAKETAKRENLIELGSDWLKKIIFDQQSELSDEQLKMAPKFINILKSCYVFEKESKHYSIGKIIVSKAGITTGDQVFKVLIKLGIWDKDENIDLYRYDIPIDFPNTVIEKSNQLVSYDHSIVADKNRKDFTHLPMMTIDGQATKDFDDAISITKEGDKYIVGVHIIDVGHFIKKGDIIDQEALQRGSSIYMPDNKIPMLPTNLSEDLCSLKINEVRPAISTLIKLDRFGDIISYEVVASIIKVDRQLCYSEVNKLFETSEDIKALYNIGKNFRQNRLDAGAVTINLPEVNVWLEENNDIVISKIDRESPSRMLVSEMMIMANWLMAKFLTKNNMPAIFRSQPEPKSRLYKGEEESLFKNCMQRKHLSRAVIGYTSEHHAGLGLNAYVTATSPIRKYFDLVTQRQIRALLGLESSYSADEIQHLFQVLEQPMSHVGRIQFMRKKYWILKYLENRIGSREEALVLEKRRDFYTVLLKEYMLECKMPIGGANLKPQDLVQVIIQHSDARNDILSVFVG